MIAEIWKNVDVMECEDVKGMIKELKIKGSYMTLEERIQLYFGLIKVNCIDNALYQMQMIYEEIKYKGLTSEFLSKHPDLKINLMAGYEIWEGPCGGIHVGPDYSEECEACCCCGGCGGLICCFTMCCDQDGTCLMKACDTDTGICCNFEEGGLCCKDNGCCDCLCCCGCCQL